MNLAIIPILFGIFTFFFVTGGEILNPVYIDWLMKGDPATHWLGWHFFRDSVSLQWPLGKNLSYGMDISSSIVFTDSIPLLAFIFKPFSSFLPDIFQYIGIWVLLCFILQSYFAWKLLSFFSKNRWLPIIGSLFFTLAPVYIIRLDGHYALFAQWVLLAGLYLYFKKEFSVIRWLILLVITSMIHAYLLIMLLLLLLTDFIQRYFLKQISIREIIKQLSIIGISLFILMYAIGYFMIGSGVGTTGFGYYHMDLLSLGDSQGIWSQIIPNQEGTIGDPEGFNYLGIGMILLTIIVFFKLLFTSNNFVLYNKAKLTPIVVLFLFLFFYALSNHIAIAGEEIYSYSLPSITQYFTQTFRASGRFFWLDYYLIYLTVFYFVFTKLKDKTIIILLIVLLVMQIIDTKYAWEQYRSKFLHPSKYFLQMDSPVWNMIAKRYKKIILVLPENKSKDWLQLSHFAANNKMQINTGFFARVDESKLSDAKVEIANSVVQNKFLDDALYVFTDENLWKMALDQISKPDIAIFLDGYRLVLPNVKDIDFFKSLKVTKENDFIYSKKQISFRLQHKQNKYLVYGWANPEPSGVWSEGKQSFLRVDILDDSDVDIQLSIDSFALLAEEQITQEVDVLINKRYIGTLKYNLMQNKAIRKLMIPKDILLQNNGKLLIEFKYKYTSSPKQLGLSDDPRILSFKLISLDFSI